MVSWCVYPRTAQELHDDYMQYSRLLLYTVDLTREQATRDYLLVVAFFVVLANEVICHGDPAKKMAHLSMGQCLMMNIGVEADSMITCGISPSCTCKPVLSWMGVEKQLADLMTRKRSGLTSSSRPNSTEMQQADMYKCQHGIALLSLSKSFQTTPNHQY